MDTTTLVKEQVDEGKLLVDQLKRHGFDVSVAFWALTSEEQLWFLYIASQFVDTNGLAAAYGKVYSELSCCPVRWVSHSQIKIIGRHNPIAVDAIRYKNQKLPTRYGGRAIGNLTVEEAYIYPN